jgi:hypothetical protein
VNRRKALNRRREMEKHQGKKIHHDIPQDLLSC